MVQALGLFTGGGLVALLFFANQRVWHNTFDQIIGTWVSLWSILVLAGLVLSAFTLLDHAVLYSIILVFQAIIFFFLVRKKEKSTYAHSSERRENTMSMLEKVLIGILLLIAGLQIITVFAFPPNNYDSLTYHLPRIHFYFAQGHLGHFVTPNERQVFFPFNATLLQFPIVQYALSNRLLNFINWIHWVIVGLLIFRLSLLIHNNRKQSIVNGFIGLTGTALLAQSTTTNNDILLASAILASVYYLLTWTKTKDGVSLVYFFLAAGLAVGTKVTVAFFIPGVILFLIIRYFKAARIKEHTVTYLKPISLKWLLISIVFFIALSSSSYFINLSEKGTVSAPGQKVYVNTPWDLQNFKQNTAGMVLQSSLNPLSMLSYQIFSIIDYFEGTAYKHTFTYRINERLNRDYLQPQWNQKTMDRYDVFIENFISRNPVEDEVWYGFSGYIVFFNLLFFFSKKKKRPDILFIALLIFSFITSYLFLMNWQPWSSRFYIAVFPLAATICYFPLEMIAKKKWGQFIMIFFLMVITFESLAYIFNNQRRPLLRISEPVSIGEQRLSKHIVDNYDGQKICLVHTSGGNDNRVYELMQKHQRLQFVQSFSIHDNAYCLLSMPDSSLIGTHEIKELIGKRSLEYIGKTNYYWFEVKKQ